MAPGQPRPWHLDVPSTLTGSLPSLHLQEFSHPRLLRLREDEPKEAEPARPRGQSTGFFSCTKGALQLPRRGQFPNQTPAYPLDCSDGWKYRVLVLEG